MKVIDITDTYIEEFLYKKDLEAYEKSHPALFEHYFSFWGDRGNFQHALAKEDVVKHRNLVQGHINHIEKRFQEAGFDIQNLEIILFVGQGCTNGHAFCDRDKFAVWIPVESYTGQLQVKAFLSHEVVHAIHYRNAPAYYFSTLAEKKDSLRQLATEGVATYVSKEIMGLSDKEALWADFISEEEARNWMEDCEQHMREISSRVLAAERGGGYNLFEANDAADIYNFRAGYYLGLMVIRGIVEEKRLSLQQLVKMTKEELDQLIRKKLKFITQKKSGT